MNGAARWGLFKFVAEVAGVPLRAAHDLRNVHETDALRAVREHQLGILALAGGPGSGKTVAASWWLMDLAMREQPPDADSCQGTSCRFVTAAAMARLSRYDPEVMRRLLRCRRLVVDDLGKEYSDDRGSFTSLLAEVVNDRFDNLRPTVFTTNLASEQIRERYDPSIADRITATQGLVVLTNPSLRRQQPPKGPDA